MYVFKVSEAGAEEDYLEGGDEDALPACTQMALPNAALQGLWSSLVVPPGAKARLLNLASSAALFARAGVAAHKVTANRLVLLHGPPGTGKTSLCRALAQRLSIRMQKSFSRSVLVEVNAHSLFSKWFSESGKLVARLFHHVQDLAEDEGQLVLVLLDEVESLAASRAAAAAAGAEPGDAVRVVNAVLTQLDALRRRRNVLCLATSNLLGAIDAAFLDRADLTMRLGLPPLEARHEILRSCLQELMRAGVVAPRVRLLGAAEVEGGVGVGVGGTPQEGTPKGVPLEWDPAAIARELYAVAKAAENMSGRALRKLPLQAHAFFVARDKCSPKEFIDAMRRVVAERAPLPDLGAMDLEAAA